MTRPLSRHYLRPAGQQQGLLLGYADVRMDQVRPAFKRLAAIIEAETGKR